MRRGRVQAVTRIRRDRLHRHRLLRRIRHRPRQVRAHRRLHHRSPRNSNPCRLRTAQPDRSRRSKLSHRSNLRPSPVGPNRPRLRQLHSPRPRMLNASVFKATALRNWPRLSAFCTDPPAKHATPQKRRSGYGNRLPSTTAQQCWNWQTSISKGMESPRTATRHACYWILQHGRAWPEREEGSVTSKLLADLNSHYRDIPSGEKTEIPAHASVKSETPALPPSVKPDSATSKGSAK